MILYILTGVLWFLRSRLSVRFGWLLLWVCRALRVARVPDIAFKVTLVNIWRLLSLMVTMACACVLSPGQCIAKLVKTAMRDGFASLRELSRVDVRYLLLVNIG